METVFISSSDVLLKHLERELENCKSFRLAVAWASSGEGKGIHWQLIDKHRDKLKEAIVGLHFHQTEPYVLYQLHEWRKLNIIYDTNGVFHSKLYLFETELGFSVIMGSSNLTVGGFYHNMESNVLVRGEKSEPFFFELEGFYRLCKKRSRIPDKIDLEKYECDYDECIRISPDLSTFVVADKRKAVMTRPGDSLPDYFWEEIFQFNWEEYVHGLKYLNYLMRSSLFNLYNEDGNRWDAVNTLDKCFESIHKFKTLSSMPEDERKFFCGTASFKTGCGWFGSMTGAGYFKNIVNTQPKILDTHLDRIPLIGTVSEDQVIEYFNGILSVEHIGSGIALRLLSMKRPDLFLSINKRTEKVIVERTNLKGLKYNSQRKEEFIEAYLEFHRRIYNSPWFQYNLPTEGIEAKISKYRVAWLDPFFYEELSGAEEQNA
ncbi:MAG: phospholipase D family protein [Leptospiraceae bacterium]|nr:phospholipase D family protein [Leptospiraceae bacterium]